MSCARIQAEFLRGANPGDPDWKGSGWCKLPVCIWTRLGTSLLWINENTYFVWTCLTDRLSGPGFVGSDLLRLTCHPVCLRKPVPNALIIGFRCPCDVLHILFGHWGVVLILWPLFCAPHFAPFILIIHNKLSAPASCVCETCVRFSICYHSTATNQLIATVTRTDSVSGRGPWG